MSDLSQTARSQINHALRGFDDAPRQPVQTADTTLLWCTGLPLPDDTSGAWPNSQENYAVKLRLALPYLARRGQVEYNGNRIAAAKERGYKVSLFTLWFIPALLTDRVSLMELTATALPTFFRLMKLRPAMGWEMNHQCELATPINPAGWNVYVRLFAPEREDAA